VQLGLVATFHEMVVYNEYQVFVLFLALYTFINTFW